MARKKKVEENLDDIKQGEVILQKSIGDIAKDAYLDFGGYINLHRHIASVYDGLKVSYRRLIYCATKFPKGKPVPTTELIASVSSIHPHSVDALAGTSGTLVKSGVFTGIGNTYAVTSLDGFVSQQSAARYTKTYLSDVYCDLIYDLIKEVDYVESPTSVMEPSQIPTPLPMSLYLKDVVKGLGVSVMALYPSFNPWSLYVAYKNNNPMLLEPSIDLLIDKEHSELNKLWVTGKGKVTYAFRISRQISPDGKTEGILFEGDTGIFVPNLKAFRKLEDEGKVYIDNVSDITGQKLFIGRIPGARGITIEDIESLARKCCYDSSTYQLNVTDDKSVFRIGMYDWIDFTYKRYIELITKVNQKKINQTEFNIAVLENLPKVSNYIINENPKAKDEELSRVLGIHPDIISAIMSKPISYIRNNKDNSTRLKNLKDQLKELKKFDPVKYTEEIIKKL